MLALKPFVELRVSKYLEELLCSKFENIVNLLLAEV